MRARAFRKWWFSFPFHFSPLLSASVAVVADDDDDAEVDFSANKSES